MSNFNNIFQNKTKIDRHIFTTSEKLLEHRFDPLKKDFLTEEDQSVLNRYLDHAYGNFKAHVLQYRKQKIKEENYDKVFSADVYTGEEALKYGLIDEIGDMQVVMKK